MKPLEGIRVLDLTMWAFVPSAGGVLAQWGADVVKVENPRSPDPSRVLGGSLEPGSASRSFNNYNRGKRAIAVDLGTDAGRDILHRLVDEADVLLTSFLPATRRKLGFDVDQVRARNPSIIYAKGTGLGPLGAESERRGYDAAIWWARGSLAHSAMQTSGAAEPTGMVGHGDAMSGLVLAGGICAAIAQRALTGRPSVVDGSLLGTATWFNHQPIIASSPGLPTPSGASPFGASRPASMSHYLTRDQRWVSLVFVNDPDPDWADLCHCLGRADLATDERFATATARSSHQDEAREALVAHFGRMTLDEVKVALAPARGVWAPVQTPDEMHHDPQVLANGYLQPVDYPTGVHHIPAPAVLFDEDPGTVGRAPDLGQHTDEVLGELGFDPDTVAAWRAGGVVA